jgi:hypothetical protein
MVNYDEEDRTYCITVYKGCSIHACSDGYYWQGGLAQGGGYYDSKAECIAEIDQELEPDYLALCVERW